MKISFLIFFSLFLSVMGDYILARVGVLLPALNPPSNFEMWNGSAIKEAINSSFEENKQRFLKNGIDLRISFFEIGQDNNISKLEDSSLAVKSLNDYIYECDNNGEYKAGLIGPSFGNTLESILNTGLISFPVFTFSSDPIESSFNSLNNVFRMIPSSLQRCISIAESLYSLMPDEREVYLISDSSSLSIFSECKVFFSKMSFKVGYSIFDDLIATDSDFLNLFYSIKNSSIKAIVVAHLPFRGFSSDEARAQKVMQKAQENGVFYSYMWFFANSLFEASSINNNEVLPSYSDDFHGIIFTQMKYSSIQRKNHFRTSLNWIFLEKKQLFERLKPYYDSLTVLSEGLISFFSSSQSENLNHFVSKVDVLGTSGRIHFLLSSNVIVERNLVLQIMNLKKSSKISNFTSSILGHWNHEDEFVWNVKSSSEIIFSGGYTRSDFSFITTLPFSHPGFNSGSDRGIPPSHSSLYCFAVDDDPNGVLNGKALYFGGSDGKTRSNSLFMYNMLTEHWSIIIPTTSTSPSVLASHSCFIFDQYFFIVGGFNGNQIVKTVFSFDVDLKLYYSFDTDNYLAPDQRMAHHFTTFIANSSVKYAFTYGGIGISGILDDCFIFDNVEWKWQEIEKFSEESADNIYPPPLYHYSITTTNRNIVLIFGGITRFFSKKRSYGEVADNTLWAFNFSSYNSNINPWTNLTKYFSKETENLSPRSDTILFIDKRTDTLHFFYGYNPLSASFFGECYEMELSNSLFSLKFVQFECPEMIKPRKSLEPLVYDSQVIFFGGEDKSSIYNDAFLLDLITNKAIKSVSSQYSPEPVSLFASFLVNSEIFIFFGKMADNSLSKKISSLNMESRIWSSVSVTSTVSPSPRYSPCFTHSAGVFYFFGGIGEDGNTMNDFWKFTPLSSEFSQISATLPSSLSSMGNREQCSLVTWKQNKLILFGGSTEENSENYFLIFDTVKKTIVSRDFINASSNSSSLSRPPGLQRCRSEVLGDYVYCFGCRSQTTVSHNVWRFSILTGQWENVFNLTAELFQTKIALTKGGDSTFFVFGGLHENGAITTNSILKFFVNDEEKMSLDILPKLSTQSPVPTIYSQAFFYKNSLVFLGGSRGYVVKDDWNPDDSYGIINSADISLDIWFYSFNNITDQTPCSAGTTPTSDGLICVLCPKGTYREENGAFACLYCPPGFYSIKEGVVSSGFCVPCSYGYYQSNFGSSSCNVCPSGSYCPIGSSVPLDSQISKKYPSTTQPSRFTKNTVLNSVYTVAFYIVGSIVWSIIVSILMFLWLNKGIKMEVLLCCDCIMNDKHIFRGSQPNPNDPYTTNKVDRKTICGGLFSILAIIIISAFFSSSLLLFYTGLDDDENTTLEPYWEDDKKFVFNLKASLNLTNYESECTKNSFSNECSSYIEIVLTNIETNHSSIKCKKSGRKCEMILEISKATVGGESDTRIDFIISSPDSSSETLQYFISTSTGYNDDDEAISSLSGEIYSDQKVFRGVDPSSSVEVSLLRTSFEFSGSINSFNSYGYHVDIGTSGETQGNLVSEKYYSTENGVAFAFILTKNDNILVIKRSNVNTIFTLIPSLFGSVVGLLGVIGGVMGVVEKFYSEIGFKNDFTQRDQHTITEIKKRIKQFQDDFKKNLKNIDDTRKSISRLTANVVTSKSEDVGLQDVDLSRLNLKQSLLNNDNDENNDLIDDKNQISSINSL